MLFKYFQARHDLFTWKRRSFEIQGVGITYRFDIESTRALMLNQHSYPTKRLPDVELQMFDKKPLGSTRGTRRKVFIFYFTQQPVKFHRIAFLALYM